MPQNTRDGAADSHEQHELIHLSPPDIVGPGQEPPHVRRAGGSGDPQGTDQGTGGKEQPAREGKLSAEEPGQSGAAGKVPVSNPDGCSPIGQSGRAGDVGAADL